MDWWGKKSERLERRKKGREKKAFFVCLVFLKTNITQCRYFGKYASETFLVSPSMLVNIHIPVTHCLEIHSFAPWFTHNISLLHNSTYIWVQMGLDEHVCTRTFMTLALHTVMEEQLLTQQVYSFKVFYTQC